LTLIEDADFFIRVVPLPYAIRAMTSPNPDGTFSVYLNSRNSYHQTLKAIDHEYKHMDKDDFYNGEPIESIENEVQTMQEDN